MSHRLAEPVPAHAPHRGRGFWGLAAPLTALALLVAGLGAAVFTDQRRRVERHALAALEATSTAQRKQIDAFLEEQGIRAWVTSRDPLLRLELRALAGAPRAERRHRRLLERRLDALRLAYGYDAAWVVDPVGRVAAASGGTALSPSERLVAAKVSNTGTTGLAWSAHPGRGPGSALEISECASVLDRTDPVPLGALVFRLNLGLLLNRAWEDRPVPGSSAANRLVTLRGGTVIQVLPAGRRIQSALRSDLVEVQALRWGNRVCRGLDARGVPTVAVAQSLASLPWALLTQVDEKEFQAPLRRLLGIDLAVGLLALALGGAMVLAWHRRATARLQRDHRRIRAENRQLVARLKDLSHLANDIILTLDGDNRIRHCNDRALAAYGCEAEDLVGRPAADLRAPAFRPDQAQQFQNLRRTGACCYETVHQRRDGTAFPVEVSCRMFRFEGQDWVQGIVRDITERKRAEAEVRDLQKQVAQSQKMESLGSLAGGIAHDMNNVLGAILALATAQVGAQPNGSPAQRAFDTIIRAADRGGRVLQRLLNLARQTPAEERDLDLNGILQEEVRLLERTTLSRVRLVQDLDPALRPVRGDANALANAVLNLCVNAVDAMPAGGTLTLRTRNLGPDRVEVQVRDTGCGMTREVREQACNPFFTTKPVGKGTGLGLTMVYQTVRAHQGTLDLQSRPGQGTCVALRLPASAPGPVPAERADEPSAPAPAGPLRLLLADDDELIRSSMEELLQMLGHQVTAVASGEELLARLEAGDPVDLAILDMNMPGLGGAGTLPRLRALRPALPVLLATGRADQPVLDLADAYPRVTLLPKPFSMKDLERHLNLDSRSGAAELAATAGA